MAAIALESIAKSFGHAPVLKGVSLAIRDGEFLSLVGPSGCGKTTLLRIIAGLELQDAGRVAIDARNVDGLAPKARDVAMVFQTYALYPHMTVAQNLAVPLVMRRLSSLQRLPIIGRLLPGTASTRAAIAREVREVAATLGIGELLGRRPGQLSGGQRQRVAVGRALVRRPSVFLMDEPLSNLDAKLRVAMRAEIKELHARLGVTFVYVTHDQAEAMTLSDRVALMMDGALIQIAPPHILHDDPDDARVAEFFGSPPINLVPAATLPPRLLAATLGRLGFAGSGLAGFGSADATAGLIVGIRPQALMLAPAGREDVLHGRLRFVEHLGADLYLHVDLAGVARPLVARIAPAEGQSLRPGAAVSLLADAAALLLFDAAGRRVRGQTGDVIIQLRERSGT